MTNTNRKDVIKIQTQKVVHHQYDKKSSSIIINTPVYTSGTESLIVVSDVDNCEITLNSSVNDKITVKSLTNVIIKPDLGLVDQEWEELTIEKGACVQFQFVESHWYIISSDGIKLS